MNGTVYFRANYAEPLAMANCGKTRQRRCIILPVLVLEGPFLRRGARGQEHWEWNLGSAYAFLTGRSMPPQKHTVDLIYLLI